MKLDFIEIGTSNFDTLIEKADESTFGISIEPVNIYLDDLPNPKNVHKLNYVISLDGSEDPVDVYYIKPEIIDKFRLKNYLKGCNSVKKYHPLHIQHNLQKYVTIDVVQQICIGRLYDLFHIEHLAYLKIDTEGGDCCILDQYYDFILDKPSLYPMKIKFETNSLSNTTHVESVLKKYHSIGYKSSKERQDTVLMLKS